jgi:hypothetical protein
MKLLKLILAIFIAGAVGPLLAACGPSGPTEADMAGCAVRSGGPPISTREVADCAVNRAELRRERDSK